MLDGRGSEEDRRQGCRRHERLGDSRTCTSVNYDLGQGLQSRLREAAYSRGMPAWVGSAATVVTALVALAALIVSIWASRRVARKREFELLLERIDRESAKREAETRAVTERFDRAAAKRDERFEREAAKRDERFEREAAKRDEAIRDVLDRSDRKFEALQRRSDELYRQWVEIASRVAHTEAVLETAAEAGPATGQSDAVAAQDVLGDRPSE